MSRQFKQDSKNGVQRPSKPLQRDRVGNGGDNSDFFLLSNFDQSGASVAPDIDPEILREEEEQSARQAAAAVAAVGAGAQGGAGNKASNNNNGQSMNDDGKHNDASGMNLHEDDQLVDVGEDDRDLGLKPDFNALQMAVNAAKLMEETGDGSSLGNAGDHHDLMSRKAGGSSNQRYLSSSTDSAQVAAAVANAVQQHEHQQQRRHLQHQKQQFPYNSAFQQNDAGSSQNSGHNLFGNSLGLSRSHNGDGQSPDDRANSDNANDIQDNYSQFLRTHPDPKVQAQHQNQQLRNLRQQQQQQQQQHMLGGRNSLSNVMSQQQMAAAANSVGVNNSNPLLASSMMNAPHHSINGKRRIRLRWSEEETKALIDGCKIHGVGNWKKILTDTRYRFNNRTAVDLKDRFRTSFPEEYSRLYPNARTHKSKRKAPPIDSSSLVKINRKERRSFTSLEDQRLLEGFERHGAAWSKIQRDETLGLSDRRSTDLRDRFRNAFPERYIAAGYKGRGTPKRTLQTLPNEADDTSYIKHNLDSAGNGSGGAGSVGYPLMASLVGTSGGYVSQGGVPERSSPSGNVPMSPTFKAAAAAFANSNIDAELADAKHQEDVMSSIKLEGLNGDDDDEDDVDETSDVLTEEERREIIERQVELEQLRIQQEQNKRQRQQAGLKGQQSQPSQGSSQSQQQKQQARSSRSASPTLIAAAAAAAAAAASVTEAGNNVSVPATNSGDRGSGLDKSGKNNNDDQDDNGDNTNNANNMSASGLQDSLLYNPLFYGNNAAHSR